MDERYESEEPTTSITGIIQEGASLPHFSLALASVASSPALSVKLKGNTGRRINKA